jgi:ribosomal protein S6E (S10)
MSLVILIIHIPDQHKRIAFAAKLRKLIPEGKTYIPGKQTGIYKSDIGIKGNITQEELAKINALIERRGYECTKRGSLHE